MMNSNPSVDQGKISTIWSNATIGDIGSGFRPASRRSQEILLERSARTRAQKELEAQQDALDSGNVAEQRALRRASTMRRDGELGNNFIMGSSRFIFYHMRINVAIKEAKSKARRAPRVQVSDNPLTAEARKAFASKVGSNIDRSTDFFWEDILPVTNSMLSAIKRVDDFSQQATDGKSELPTEYIKRKITQAVQLRIIRHVSDSLELTKQERALMVSEFRSPRSMF